MLVIVGSAVRQSTSVSESGSQILFYGRILISEFIRRGLSSFVEELPVPAISGSRGKTALRVIPVV